MDAETPAPAPAATLPNFDPLNETVMTDILNQEAEDVVARLKELDPKFDEWMKIGDITTRQDAEDLTDFLEQVSKLNKTADDRREKRKIPYDAISKVIQKVYKHAVMDVLATKAAPLKQRLNVWLDKQKEIAKAAAQVEIEAAQRAVAAATTPAEIKAASHMLKEAQKKGKSAGIKTDFGSTAHQTSRWDFDVTDITKVPAKFLTVDRTAVMAFIGTGTVENPVTIEGILVKRSTSAAV